MFAALPLEREPFQFKDIPSAVPTWLQEVGGFAAFSLAIVVAVLLWQFFFGRRPARDAEPGRKSFVRSGAFKVLVALVALLYLAAFGARLPYLFRLIGASLSEDTSPPPAPMPTRLEEWLLTSAGACALLVAALPLLLDLFKFRWRRIWAIAKLSFKEALRRRILWVFSAILLVFL